MLIKFRIWDKITKRYIEEDTDYLNRENYSLGNYALNSDGTVNFYESTDGGMSVEEYKTCEVQIELGIVDKHFNNIFDKDIVNLSWGKESKFIDGGIENEVVIPCEVSRNIMGINNWYYSWGNIIFKPLITKEEFKKLTKGLSCQFNPYGNHWEIEIIGNSLTKI